MKKLKKVLIAIFIIFVILYFIVTSYIIYRIIEYDKETSPYIDENTQNQLNTYILDYLNNKYGKNSFNVEKLEKDFSYNGIISETHTGYKARISSAILENTFEIRISKTKPSPIRRADDDFVQTYYEQVINKHFEKIYNLKSDIRIIEGNIPNNNGYIPTFNELINLYAFDNLYIHYYQDDYDNDINKRIENIKNIAIDLINYLDISEDFNYNFDKLGKDNYEYEIYITKDTLRIINRYNNEETYEFNMNEVR